MVGVTFLTGGLFFTPSTEPLWQKFVKLFTYCIAIAMGAIFTVIKEYEKGAFGVPNDLEEINQIWHEFEAWEIPGWIIAEVDKLNQEETEEHVNGKNKRSLNDRTDIQKEQKNVDGIQSTVTNSVVSVSCADDNILLLNDRE
jgi:hypothetical protein